MYLDSDLFQRLLDMSKNETEKRKVAEMYKYLIEGK